MVLPYASASEGRRQQLRRSLQTINGIDYVELLSFDVLAPGDTGAYLLVYMLKPDGVTAITPELVAIRGGARLTTIGVAWSTTALGLVLGGERPPFWSWSDAGGSHDHEAELIGYFVGRGEYSPSDPATAANLARVLVVRTWTRGDLAEYTLSLTSPPGVVLDQRLATARFSFQVEESEFDLGNVATLASLPAEEPVLDYLSKDFASFRRLMLDRMSTLLPEWTERNAADLGVSLVEVMSAAADYLGYYQDAVATEAYLGTARQRVSVRRHARLLDYVMHDGCNARTFVALEVGSDLTLASRPDNVVQFLTAVDTLKTAVHLDDVTDPTVLVRAEVFEPLQDALLSKQHNAIRFYTWGDTEVVLSKGAVQATLRNEVGGGLALGAGDLLLLEEVRDPQTGDEGEARREQRQIVRLTSVVYTADPLYDEGSGAPYLGSALNPNPLQVAEVSWSDADALAFELQIGAVRAPDGTPLPVSVARGNVLLVDHGRTVLPAEVSELSAGNAATLRLDRSPLTQQGRVRDQRGVLVTVDSAVAASHALVWDLRDVQPVVALRELGVGGGPSNGAGEDWQARRDLLGSDRFASEFVLEIDDEQRASLRFGDDFMGRRPLPGTRFAATYRTGSGTRGNISAEALRHVVFTSRSAATVAAAATTTGILRVRNPLPAVGGIEPQSASEVRLLAPTAFREQERAVTESDYARVAERHPEVRRAAAVFRWTGSWHTVFIFVDRGDGAPVDDAFRTRLGAFVDRYRMSRHDVRIESPRYVALDIAFVVHVADDYLRSNVRQALLEVFSNVVQSNGARGFFHPQAWTFGQPVLLSRLIATAMAVPGVAWVDFTPPAAGDVPRFQRWGTPPHGELQQGAIAMGPLEIARLDNDAGRPENGRLELVVAGVR
jgi:hypothetical protein